MEYRYEKREKRDKPVVKKMRPVMETFPKKSNKRDKKNSVSAFKGKM